jgi:HEAT repeat protein
MRPSLFLSPLFILLSMLPGRMALAADKPEAPDAAQLKVWATQLGDDDYQKREEAQAKLAEAGPAAIPYLKEALKNEDLEVRQRAERLLAPLNREEHLTEAAQTLGDPDWEKVTHAIDVLLDRCDEKSENVVAQAAAGAGRNASMAQVLQKEIQSIRKADDEIARFVEMGKRNRAVKTAVDKKKDEVQRVYRQRAYESCRREFERLKTIKQEPAARP